MLGEDASRIRTGSAPEAMPGLGNAAISVLRRSRGSNSAAALRDNLYHVGGLLAKSGILSL
jgi:hypothetical protein